MSLDWKVTFRIHTIGIKSTCRFARAFPSRTRSELRRLRLCLPCFYGRLYERSAVLALQSADQPGRTMVKTNRSRPPLAASLAVLKQQLRQDVLQQSPAHAAELYGAAIHLLGALKQDQSRLSRIG